MPDSTADSTHSKGATKVGEDNPWAAPKGGHGYTVSVAEEEWDRSRGLTRDRGCDQRGPCLFVAGVEVNELVNGEWAGTVVSSLVRRVTDPRSGARLETFALGPAHDVPHKRVARDADDAPRLWLLLNAF